MINSGFLRRDDSEVGHAKGFSFLKIKIVKKIGEKWKELLEISKNLNRVENNCNFQMP